MNFIYSIINGISEVSPDGWASFIGSALSFLGVFITIKYTKKQFKDEMKMSEEQFKDDKRISVKPYLDIKLKELSNSTNSFDLITINKLKNLNLYEESFIGIELSNLGQGNCLECKLIEIRIGDKKVNDGLNVGSIVVNESKSREITFIVWYGDILNEIKEKYIGKREEDYPNEFEYNTHKYCLNKIEMQFEYKDVLENKYSKTIVIDIFIFFKIYLGASPYFKISNIEFEGISYEINGNSTTEKLIK